MRQVARQRLFELLGKPSVPRENLLLGGAIQAKKSEQQVLECIAIGWLDVDGAPIELNRFFQPALRAQSICKTVSGVGEIGIDLQRSLEARERFVHIVDLQQGI